MNKPSKHGNLFFLINFWVFKNENFNVVEKKKRKNVSTIKETLMFRVTANAENLFNHEKKFLAFIDNMDAQVKKILENMDLMKKHTTVLNEDWAGMKKKNFELIFVFCEEFFIVFFCFIVG